MSGKRYIVLLFCLVLPLSLWSGTTGKIAGTIIDKATGDPLPGANITVVGSALGAAADLNGNYTILHVPPGVFEIQVSVIGYTTVRVSDVRVLIDQTARVDVDMAMEALKGEAITIVAERALIKKDVATSVVSISNQEVEDLPVFDVDGVVSLQAGINNDLAIRGGDGKDALFMLDGVTLRDPRNNEPVTKVALSAVKEISIERGGFNAEYGHVQSGLVNVVTREGDKHMYQGSISTKISPPAPKYWRGNGIPDVFDTESFWMRPYLDNEVCWTGTSNGTWDEYTQNEYPDFIGWNEFSNLLCTDNDPTNNLTPLAAQRVFMYEARKRPVNDQPDYDVDGGFGGPVPFISEKLGNLRFFTSYRRYREILLFPMTRPDYMDYDWSMQVTSDISSSMKLRVSTLIGKKFTMADNWNQGVYVRTPEEVAGHVNTVFFNETFADWDLCLADIGHRSLSAKLTHTLNPKTFYEISLEQFRRDYYIHPTRWRDTTTLYEVVPGYYRDENPFGYYPDTDVGFILGSTSHASKARDNSIATSTTLKADMISQINFKNLIKTGVEFVYNDLDLDYGTIASASGGRSYSNRVQMHIFPIRAAAYIQDKMETKGFTLNAGLRLDYSDTRANWWNVDPYDRDFFSSNYNPSEEFTREKSKPQWQFSPRLGISHPITENSKLYFNYGHFKQMPQYETLFRVERTSDKKLTGIGDPNLILAKTISYELGYDHVLLNDFLIQMAAFYKDVTNQQDMTEYNSISGLVYERTTDNDYKDIRGFEVTLRKPAGRWWSGFANYTYQVSTSGHFGRDKVYQDPALQKDYDEDTVNLYQDRPIPRPYARANLSFYSPDNFGPSLLGHHLFGGIMCNMLVDWQAGEWVEWNPKNDPRITNNVKSRDWLNTMLRFSKTFKVHMFKIQFLMDIDNALNTLRLNYSDDLDYRYSLHLPESNDYDNIVGNDKIGDYRKPGVDYQPMEYRAEINRSVAPQRERVIYFEGRTGQYWQYVNNQWTIVESRRMYQILKDKAYIDMPRISTFWFLNPRKIYFGLKVTFDL